MKATLEILERKIEGLKIENLFSERPAVVWNGKTQRDEITLLTYVKDKKEAEAALKDDKLAGVEYKHIVYIDDMERAENGKENGMELEHRRMG